MINPAAFAAQIANALNLGQRADNEGGRHRIGGVLAALMGGGRWELENVRASCNLISPSSWQSATLFVGCLEWAVGYWPDIFLIAMANKGWPVEHQFEWLKEMYTSNVKASSLIRFRCT